MIMLININDQSESLGEPIIIAFKFFGFSFCFKKIQFFGYFQSKIILVYFELSLQWKKSAKNTSRGGLNDLQF